MYDDGVLVQNPIDAVKFFRKRMGFKNPTKAATKLADAQYGFQGKWRGQTYDKREYVAGVHNGDMPGADTNTDILQARAMNPWSAKATNRMDYINPSWQANVSEFGGHSGTIEMLAGGHDRALPMAMDNLEQISANALDENKRDKAKDPLSSTYAMEHMGLGEILANDRAARLAYHRGKAVVDQDITVDLSKGDAENNFNTSYQGPALQHANISKFIKNPWQEKQKRDIESINLKTTGTPNIATELMPTKKVTKKEYALQIDPFAGKPIDFSAPSSKTNKYYEDVFSGTPIDWGGATKVNKVESSHYLGRFQQSKAESKVYEMGSDGNMMFLQEEKEEEGDNSPYMGRSSEQLFTRAPFKTPKKPPQRIPLEVGFSPSLSTISPIGISVATTPASSLGYSRRSYSTNASTIPERREVFPRAEREAFEADLDNILSARPSRSINRNDSLNNSSFRNYFMDEK